jgi:hypothetical protein
MFNYQRFNEEDDDDDDIGIEKENFFEMSRWFLDTSTILDKIRSIITYIYTYQWWIYFILLIFVLYASVRGCTDMINSFNTGKYSV